MKKLLLTIAFSALLPAAGIFADDNPDFQHECTSWMVFSDLTGNNTNILHKNRDSVSRELAVTLSSAKAKYKWIALGSGDCNMGINIHGVAGVMNSGEPCDDHTTDKSKKSTPSLLRAVLESSETAAEAVKNLEKIVKSGDYYHSNKGSIFFLMDTKEGYICEFTIKNFTVQRYDRNYAVRANIWQNPGTQSLSRSSITRYLDSSARAYIAYSGLNKIIKEDGKITPPAIFNLSRHCEMPKESPLKRSVCCKNTNSTASLEIDRQYPGVLSTGYFTIGHPRHTVYVPVPVCTQKVLPKMADFTWGNAAFKRYDEKGLTSPLPKEWLDFEKNSFARYSEAKAGARKLLEAGKRAEAEKLLNDTAYQIWCEAEKLLNI